MSADAISDRDAYGRLYHQQVYLTGGESAKGSYVDSIEIGFDPPLDATGQSRFLQIVHAELGVSAVQRVAWPMEGQRVFLSLARGFYRLDSFYAAVEAAGLLTCHRGAFYSGRLGKDEAPAGSQSPNRR